MWLGVGVEGGEGVRMRLDGQGGAAETWSSPPTDAAFVCWATGTGRRRGTPAVGDKKRKRCRYDARLGYMGMYLGAARARAATLAGSTSADSRGQRQRNVR